MLKNGIRINSNYRPGTKLLEHPVKEKKCLPSLYHPASRHSSTMLPEAMVIFISVTLLDLAAIGVSSVQADELVTTGAIAGIWYGNMHFSNRNNLERIQFSIPAGCQPGSVCGTLLNYPVQCTWEITYDGFSGGAYQYHFSNTLEGVCPAGSAGSLTLMPDSTLYRTHRTPMFTATGYLNQLPNALK
jgi:hypothetical protein